MNNIKSDRIIIFSEERMIKAVYIKCYLFEEILYIGKDIEGIYDVMEGNGRKKAVVCFSNKEESRFELNNNEIESIDLMSTKYQIENYLRLT